MSVETINVPVEISKRQLRALSWDLDAPSIISRERIREIVTELWMERVRKAESEYLAFKRTQQPQNP